MSERAVKLTDHQSDAAPEQVSLGRVVAIDDGTVVLESGDGRRISAAVTDSVGETLRKRNESLVGEIAVIGNFESGEVVLGFLSDDPTRDVSDDTVHSHSDMKDRLQLSAQKEVRITCGKSEIRLTADGKVIVKGTDVVSRASRRNKIKGSSVGIN